MSQRFTAEFLTGMSMLHRTDAPIEGNTTPT